MALFESESLSPCSPEKDPSEEIYLLLLKSFLEILPEISTSWKPSRYSENWKKLLDQLLLFRKREIFKFLRNEDQLEAISVLFLEIQDISKLVITAMSETLHRHQEEFCENFQDHLLVFTERKRRDLAWMAKKEKKAKEYRQKVYFEKKVRFEKAPDELFEEQENIDYLDDLFQHFLEELLERLVREE
ncbi:MAG: hypothetical protein HUU50_01010 [Candidatus Brocadiae bacterium]|nr:hypothetical protein [Candidatus Brocadiia bacterium]